MPNMVSQLEQFADLTYKSDRTAGASDTCYCSQEQASHAAGTCLETLDIHTYKRAGNTAIVSYSQAPLSSS